MSIWKNGKLVAGGSQALPLLTFMWADHILDNMSWLRADIFSWQNGSVYQAVYQHLANDIDGKTLQSETIGGTTIQFYLADDGHKICPASEESNVVAIYNATGVAWYYIIDTTNERFKLPRTKFGFTGLRDTVGNYVEPSLPSFNSVGNSNYINSDWTMTDFASPQDATVGSGTSRFKTYKYSFGSSEVVQPAATQMYLYFYVGQFTQTALENTAGVVTEDFNELNAHKVIEFQAPTAQNNYTWYRKYADGWVEQGGSKASGGSGNHIIDLPVTMSDTAFWAQVTRSSGASTTTNVNVWVRTPTSTSQITVYTSDDTGIKWEVRGMAA